MKDAVDWLKKLTSKDEVVIVFNNDGDGVCSCAVIKIYLEKLGIDPYIISQPMPPEKTLIKRIQTGLPNKIVFLDMAMHDEPNVIKKLSGIADILIVDHHVITRDLTSKNVLHFNPRFEDPKIYQSTSYLAYKLCSEITDIKDYDWVAAVGAISDYDLSSSTDLIKDVEKKHNTKDLHTIANMIGDVKATQTLNLERVVELLTKSKSPKEILSMSDFVKAHQVIETEIKNGLDDAESSGEKIGPILFYNLKSKYNIRSPLSTNLAGKFKDKIVIIYQKIGNNINASCRNQSKKFDLNQLLRKASKGLNANAGGHEAAAGATVNEKDWETFKERLIKLAR